MRKNLFFLEFTFGKFLHARKVDTIRIYFQIVTIIFAFFLCNIEVKRGPLADRTRNRYPVLDPGLSGRQPGGRPSP